MNQQKEIKLEPSNGAEVPPDYLLDTTVAELLADSTPHQRTALGLLAISHCYGLPLAPMLGRLAGEASGSFSRQAMYLASQVHRGEQPLAVIQDLNRVLTSSSTLALQVASDQGSLSNLYRAVLRRPPEPDSDADADKDLDARFSRLMLRGFFVMFVVSFTVIRIFPEFQKMFVEFGMELPAIMEMVITVLNWSAKLWFVWALLLVLLGLWVAPRYLRRWNPVSWRKNVIPKSALRRQTLAIVAQNGDASESGVARIASSSLLRKFFPKLAKASAQTDTGQASWKALAAQGLITRREASTLASTHSGETQAWLLRWSASALGDQVRSRSNWGFNLVIWTGNILLAGVVFIMCLTIFSSLLAIMRGLV